MNRKNFIRNTLLSFASILFIGCNDEPKPEGETDSKKSGDYVIKTIDGCQYIEYDYGYFDQRVYSLTHKGNCNNPQHNPPIIFDTSIRHETQTNHLIYPTVIIRVRKKKKILH